MTFALLVVAGVVGCVDPSKPDPAVVTDTDADADTDTDSDTDADTDTDTDTPTPFETDDDGDGYSEAQGDCDDANTLVKPAYLWETCGNEIDDDCNGTVDDGCGAGMGYLWSIYSFDIGPSFSFGGGRSGWALRTAEDALICASYRVQDLVGPAPEGCPNCEWSFEVKGGSYVLEGPYCDEIADTASRLDLRLWESPEYTTSVGFAWTGYGYAGAPTEEILWVWSEGLQIWGSTGYDMDRYGIDGAYVDGNRYGTGEPWGYAYEYTPPD